MYLPLREKHFPVARVFALLESAIHWLVITVDKAFEKNFTSDELVNMVSKIVFNTKAGATVPKIILVDNDIDPSEVNQVVWAFATRCHPEFGVKLYKNVDAPPLIAFLTPHEKQGGIGPKVIYNCLAPYSWSDLKRPIPVRFNYCWPEEIQKKVLDNWNNYGYQSK
jgi:UbiD family decarboxylase